jgi:hypothetical protein
MEDDFGLKWGEIEFACCNAMGYRSVGVFEGNSKAVEAVVFDVEVDILVRIATGELIKRGKKAS